MALLAGQDYPNSYAELRAWFNEDWKCLAMQHRYRSVMVRPGRNRLTDDVEVDEAFLGGPEPGVPGRGAPGKVLFAAAVELNTPQGSWARSTGRHRGRQRRECAAVPARQRRARQLHRQ